MLNNVIPKFTRMVPVVCMSKNILHVNWNAFNGAATNKNTLKLKEDLEYLIALSINACIVDSGASVVYGNTSITDTHGYTTSMKNRV